MPRKKHRIHHFIGRHSRVFMAASGLFLFTLCMGLLIFGENEAFMNPDTLHQAAGAVRADMLYVQPSAFGH